MAEEPRQPRFEREEPITDTFVPPVEAGQVLAGHYRLVREIGRGGMGVVWLAEDENLGREIALKFLPPHLKEDEDALEDLRREAEKVSRLDHPNITTLYSFERDWDPPFLVSQYAPGVLSVSGKLCYDLRSWLKERGPFSETEARRAMMAILNALGHAHRFVLKGEKKGVIHLDIKPANILLAPEDSEDDTPDGLGFKPLLTDFGIALAFALLVHEMSRVGSASAQGVFSSLTF